MARGGAIVELPSYEGGSTTGGLLVLLVGAYLLLAFITGRLGWLTTMVNQVFQAQAGTAAAPVTPNTSPSFHRDAEGTTTAYPNNRARPRTAYPGTQAYA